MERKLNSAKILASGAKRGAPDGNAPRALAAREREKAASAGGICSRVYLGISRVGSGSGRAEKNPVKKLMARTRPWPGENTKMLARARPQPDPTARGPTR